MKKGKSCGHDGISQKVFETCSDLLVPYIVKIFNRMISCSIYPDILKIHKVVPIPKEKNCCVIEKFRPISVLPLIDNIFERIIYDKLSKFCNDNCLLYDYQFGFRKGCGTEEATVNIINSICDGLDQGNSGVAGIFYDLSKAFDLIDHEILIRKLRYYGICGTELS